MIFEGRPRNSSDYLCSPRPRTRDMSNPRPRLALEDLIKSTLVLVLEIRGRGRGNLEKPRLKSLSVLKEYTCGSILETY